VTYRVAVAVSGRGTNLIALHRVLSQGSEASVVTVVSDRDASALAWAAAAGLPTHRLADPRDGAEWLGVLEAAGADLLVLAGYLRLVPGSVVSAWLGRVINVHPALLPRYGGKGMHGLAVHQAVLDAGDTETGVTVHLVDEVYDRGAVIAQVRVPVPDGATPQILAAEVLAAEHRLLPAAVLAAARAGHPVPLELE
jgi:phosphoribosylglycinamide formyltransferase-1